MVTILLMLKYVLLSFMFKPFMGGFFYAAQSYIVQIITVFISVYDRLYSNLS